LEKNILIGSEEILGLSEERGVLLEKVGILK
jgi:hypothetical protein